MNDNELSILELIHLFVEVLDGYFGNVCELDLVFHFAQGLWTLSKTKMKRVFLSWLDSKKSVLENDKLNMSWSSFKVFQRCLNLLSCWKKLTALTVASQWFQLPRSLLFQVYRILDELLLAGEVSETSTSKIIAIMKSVDKMDWCTDGCSVPGTIPVRWVEADRQVIAQCKLIPSLYIISMCIFIYFIT